MEKHLRVAVYTIALNEAAHVERWARSAEGADYRVIIDTGSTDGTQQLATALGVLVHQVAIRPFRFDDARNVAIALLPTDVDVCCTMDMDRWLAPGWRAALEVAWRDDTTALFCTTTYRTSVDDPRALRSWPTKNFHARFGYRFRRPVHEHLVYNAGEERCVSAPALEMFEVQDLSKGTRASYLPLMEQGVREDPSDGQVYFWLAREYFWAGRMDEASASFQNYLTLPSSTWPEERAEAMRFLAKIVPDRAEYWLDRARNEAPRRREIWLDLAEYYHGREDWLALYWACASGIERSQRSNSYLDDNQAWSYRLHDLGAIAAWHIGALARAVHWGRAALEQAPNDGRLQNNLAFFEQLRAQEQGGARGA